MTGTIPFVTEEQLRADDIRHLRLKIEEGPDYSTVTLNRAYLRRLYAIIMSERPAPPPGDRPPPLFKTTVVIWSREDPSGIGEPDEHLSMLAREAEVGSSYCSRETTERIEDPASDPDWDGTEFFGEDLVG